MNDLVMQTNVALNMWAFAQDNAFEALEREDWEAYDHWDHRCYQWRVCAYTLMDCQRGMLG